MGDAFHFTGLAAVLPQRRTIFRLSHWRQTLAPFQAALVLSGFPTGRAPV